MVEAMSMRGGKKRKSAGSGRKAQWPAMEALLALAIRKRRAKGLKCRTAWVIRSARRILKEIQPDQVEKFKGSARWLRAFAKRNRFSQRRGTNHKNKSAASRLPKLWRFHRGLRTLLSSDSNNPSQVTNKWGRYPPRARYNVDQVPLAFDMGAG